MQNPIDHLIALLARMPGLGPRSARRAALHLIRHKEKLMLPLAAAISDAAQAVRACALCGNMDTQDPCRICADPTRDAGLICVVEDIADLWAIERSHSYKGRYHVLGGTLSALDGRGPDALNIDPLIARVQAGGVREVILATNATVEGQTTAHYICERLAGLPVRPTRLAQGIPFGGELDYLDEGTLGAAFKARLAVAE